MIRIESLQEHSKLKDSREHSYLAGCLQISDALARTLKQLGNVTSEAENRKPILDAIVGLQTTLTESEWLAAYEDDPNKYKVRSPSTQTKSVSKITHSPLLAFQEEFHSKQLLVISPAWPMRVWLPHMCKAVMSWLIDIKWHSSHLLPWFVLGKAS